MLITAAVAVLCGVAGFLAAMLAAWMSTAPGFRALRSFAAVAATAAGFTIANVVVTLPVRDATIALGSRLAATFAALHSIAWFAYSAASERRPMRRGERIYVLGCVVLAILAPIPRVVLTDQINVRAVDWLDVEYRDVLPASLGNVALVYITAGLFVQFLRYARAALRRTPGAITHAVALGTICIAAIHDTIAMMGLIQTPYLLEVAMLVMIVLVGGRLASTFISTARALESSVGQLARIQNELVERERLAAVGELAAVVAHEIRNPLAVVFNALSVLPNVKPHSADYDTLLRVAQEEATRLRDIVTSLLDFARPSPPSFASEAIVPIVHDAVESARRAMGLGADATSIAASTDDVVTICDSRLLHQAVVNLVTNALQAEGRKSPVKVAVQRSSLRDGWLEIAVADDGHGIQAELRDKIFSPFFTTRATGTGLGLGVVQRCAKIHRGDVTVAETPGGGATFTLRFPTSSGAPTREASDADESLIPEGATPVPAE